ncbi:MAG: hypothetical protein MMC23_001201 [Stictis urceolatum]|nr:hypothetical protein [Stictis urceolata]
MEKAAKNRLEVRIASFVSCDCLKAEPESATSSFDLISGCTDALALGIIYHYKLAHAISLDSSSTYPQISQKSGFATPLCIRAIRMAITSQIFSETPQGEVQHTAISRLLVTDPGFADAIGLEIDEIGPTHGQNVAEPGKTAFSVYNGAEEGFFGYLGGRFPERARRFGAAMGFFTRDESWDLRFVWEAGGWGELNREGGTVVDVGGGHGHISLFVAEPTERLRFVVQDLPHVVEQGERELAGERRNRVGFEAHDFMSEQREGREVRAFLLRWILHNWGDKYAVQILRGLVPAMSKGTKVMIYEYVLDDKPVQSSADKMGLQVDMVMACLFNGMERYRADFVRLLKEADERLVLEGVRRPKGSAMSLVKVGWAG